MDKGSEWTERSGGGDWVGGGGSGGPAVVPPADKASDHVLFLLLPNRSLDCRDIYYAKYYGKGGDGQLSK